MSFGDGCRRIAVVGRNGPHIKRLARLVCCLDYPNFERIHSRESVFEIIAGNICVSNLQFSGANKAEFLVGDAKQKMHRSARSVIVSQLPKGQLAIRNAAAKICAAEATKCLSTAVAAEGSSWKWMTFDKTNW